MVGRVVILGLAVTTIPFVYAMGLPDVGGALFLSGLAGLIVKYARSGALSTSWLAPLNLVSIRRSANLELAKAFLCAGIGVDGVRVWVHFANRLPIPNTDVQVAVIIAFLLVTVIGTGLFLVRWFAAYLIVKRS